MSRDEALRKIANELRLLGWTFVAARERVQCHHYAMQDQEATRRCGVAGPSLLALDVLGAVRTIGMRRETRA